MENKQLFALTVLEVINLNFRTTYGNNPIHIGFENQKGNKVYVSMDNRLFGISDNKIRVSAYKVSKRCSLIEIENESDIEKMKNELITKLKLVV